MRRAMALLWGLAVVVGCSTMSGVERQRDVPPPNYVCRNTPMLPPNAFRMYYLVYLADGTRMDTTPRFVNRHLEPHRSVDTVTTTTTVGVLHIIFSRGDADTSTYCVTLFDSLAHHIPNWQGAIVVP